MFRTLLIANRGEIALRIMRTARKLGIRCVAVYSDADRGAQHVEMADEAWHIGPAPAAQSYLDQSAILEACRRSGADALHPGYGFLSENAVFAEAVIAAGIVFVGPPAAAMRAMGLKDEARRIMAAAGVPVIPGYDGADQSPAKLAEAAQRIGYPVLIKPLAGGGGRGMRIVRTEAELPSLLEAARREAEAGFGDGRVMLEKYLPSVRHVEVQVIADRHGNTLHLWERDCSLQRRHQKVIEEAPAPNLPPRLRAAMCDAAIEAARRVNYEGAGTVEFLVPLDDGAPTGDFHFIEMNTRLQVEHPVTEAVTGVDLVALQLRIAAGERIGLSQEDIRCEGHAIEARIYAEDPAHGFAPQTGTITAFDIPAHARLRFDGSLRVGDRITSHYDAMIGKLIAHGGTREAAVMDLAEALSRCRIGGVTTNLGFLGELLALKEFAAATHDTSLIESSLESTAGPPPLIALAGAVLVILGRVQAPSTATVFSRTRGFQLWGASRSVTLLHRGKLLTAEVTESPGTTTISHEGEHLALTLLRATAQEMWLEHGSQVTRVLWHDGAAVEIGCAGQRFAFARPASDVADSDEAGPRVIASPVPGRLARILVEDGDLIRAGDTIGIVEAMKTEFTLRAEARGIVHLRVPEGAQVRQGEVIAEIGGADG